VWQEITVKNSDIQSSDFDSLMNGEIPAIVVRDFYDKKQCERIVKKIENS
jgi:hypothetical protein